MRTAYWIASNPSFGIQSIRICNLAGFARKIGLTNVHMHVMKARKNNEKEVTIQGWTISWSYQDALTEILTMKNIPMAPPPAKKTLRAAWEKQFEERSCMN